MIVWVVMWDSMRGGAGVVSIHASMASALGAALKVMENEDDGEWSLDPFHMNEGTSRPPFWTSCCYNNLFIQEHTVVGV